MVSLLACQNEILFKAIDQFSGDLNSFIVDLKVALEMANIKVFHIFDHRNSHVAESAQDLKIQIVALREELEFKEAKLKSMSL